MDPIVLDTDVASLRFKGELPAPMVARLAGRRPLITFVTLAELTKWADLPLATLNVKDFADFAEHEGLTLVSH